MEKFVRKDCTTSSLQSISCTVCLAGGDMFGGISTLKTLPAEDDMNNSMGFSNGIKLEEEEEEEIYVDENEPLEDDDDDLDRYRFDKHVTTSYTVYNSDCMIIYSGRESCSPHDLTIRTDVSSPLPDQCTTQHQAAAITGSSPSNDYRSQSHSLLHY